MPVAYPHHLRAKSPRAAHRLQGVHLTSCALLVAQILLFGCKRDDRISDARASATAATNLASVATNASPAASYTGDASTDLASASTFSAMPAPKARSAVALACLARLYGGAVNGAALRVGDQQFPFEDGRARTVDDHFEEPDLHDLFVTPYPRTPIAAVTDPGEDPGRVRHEPLLRAVYGENQFAIERQLRAFPFFGQPVRVHAKALPAFERVRTRLESAVAREPSLAKYFQHIGGTYNYRKIAGSFRTSAHAFGIAIDIAVAYSHYWRNEREKPQWKNLIPTAIVDAFEAEQFVWGGRWFHYDTMHFEYRPEFFAADCVAATP
jgi:D-alanyl-D-alanine carboxypeptidase